MTNQQIQEIEEQLYFESVEKDLELEKAEEIYEETINDENMEDLK